MIVEGSLCTGYGGLGMGLPGHVRHAFVSEIEEGPASVLADIFPGVPNLGDVTIADFGAWRGKIDVLTSGDPCQSISIAGRQAGRSDARFLWPNVRAAYRAIRPEAIFFENVANMVAHDGGRTMAERFEHLTSDGYSVRWTVLGACAVGAPHHRHRWFALATRGGRWVERIGDKVICGAPRAGGRALLPTPKATDGSNGGPNQRDGAGNYYLPGITNLLPTPGARDTKGRNQRDDATCLPGAVREDRWGRYAEAIELWEALTGIDAPQPTEDAPRGGQRLSARLPEWMMGLPAGLLTGRLPRNAALKAAGNGVVPHAAGAAWRILNEGKVN